MSGSAHHGNNKQSNDLVSTNLGQGIILVGLLVDGWSNCRVTTVITSIRSGLQTLNISIIFQ